MPRPSGGRTGAFWGSIHGTLVHILWGDGQWMSRFDNWPKPATPIKESDHFIEDWAELRAARDKADADISRWADEGRPGLARPGPDLVQRRRQREISAPKRLLVTHFFNHQTHHRGQAHAMITAAGEKTDDTDLFLLHATKSSSSTDCRVSRPKALCQPPETPQSIRSAANRRIEGGRGRSIPNRQSLDTGSPLEPSPNNGCCPVHSDLVFT